MYKKILLPLSILVALIILSICLYINYMNAKNIGIIAHQLEIDDIEVIFLD